MAWRPNKRQVRSHQPSWKSAQMHNPVTTLRACRTCPYDVPGTLYAWDPVIPTVRAAILGAADSVIVSLFFSFFFPRPRSQRGCKPSWAFSRRKRRTHVAIAAYHTHPKRPGLLGYGMCPECSERRCTERPQHDVPIVLRIIPITRLTIRPHFSIFSRVFAGQAISCGSGRIRVTRPDP